MCLAESVHVKSGYSPDPGICQACGSLLLETQNILFYCLPLPNLPLLLFSDALPEGLTRELPSADEFQKSSVPGSTDTSVDDLEILRRQLDALNAD
ncbi:hypothetical protein Patl1_01216 [Pistacia atlantica]|uniref:Uncharacterized protein n=1 Tax=Pistacia atlantica TaxID=434234 RepID=A0ACC1C8G3_9ROSI|nr:hypothetical protein Patl1_01216 [Pistacia atlantica]